MAAEDLGEWPGLPSIYKASRSIKRRENCLLYNSLRSIYEDSIFVGEIAQLWPELPLVANLRCGLWYSSRFHSTCYFKSTDGHTNNWSFSTSRLNLHVATLAGQRGGCLIVDSTRKGKRFPDSMSKTIPIWACVLNRAIARRLVGNGPGQRVQGSGGGGDRLGDLEANYSTNEGVDGHVASFRWDTSLHLPLWVSCAERAAIENRLEEWTQQLEDCGADIDTLVSSLEKPLRPLWISQMTVVWLNEVPTADSWDFTPIILVSASSPSGIVQRRSHVCEFSWHYIAGAGDDEESWARGLSPNLFWKHASELIRSGPDLCNQSVAELVERDRVYRAQRGESAPQVSTKIRKPMADNDGCPTIGEDSNGDCQLFSKDHASMSSDHQEIIFWVGATKLAIGSTSNVESIANSADCVLDCDSGTGSRCSSNASAYLHLPVVTPKIDRSSLLKSLPLAISFAKSNLCGGKRLLISCHNGEDISVCVGLAILTCLYDEFGIFDEGKSFSALRVTKWEVRKRLVFLCKYVTSARPCRRNLKQVYSFLCKANESFRSVAVDDAA